MAPHWRDIETGDPEYVELVIAVVLVWGITDTASTLTAASFVGGHLESNPIVRGLLVDPVGLLTVKLGATLAVGVLALAGERFIRTLPWWRGWLATLVGVGVGVTLLNVAVALQPAL
jgi:hypothetical protein